MDKVTVPRRILQERFEVTIWEDGGRTWYALSKKKNDLWIAIRHCQKHKPGFLCKQCPKTVSPDIYHKTRSIRDGFTRMQYDDLVLPPFLIFWMAEIQPVELKRRIMRILTLLCFNESTVWERHSKFENIYYPNREPYVETRVYHDRMKELVFGNDD